MANVVDSTKKKLSPPEIMTMYTNDYNSSELPDDQIMLSIVKELTMPDVDVIQFGNTVFIGHRGKGEYKNAMFGRGMNVDTGKNFTKNSLDYVEHLRKIGVQYYRTDFYYEGYLKYFEKWREAMLPQGDDLDVMKLSDGGFRAFVVVKPEGDS